MKKVFVSIILILSSLILCGTAGADEFGDIEKAVPDSTSLLVL